MARTKYPETERITCSRLAVGDLLLVRNRGTDTLFIKRDGEPFELADYTDPSRHIPPGLHRVAAINPWLRQGGHKASRYYDVELVASDDCASRIAEISSVNRVNRVLTTSTPEL